MTPPPHREILRKTLAEAREAAGKNVKTCKDLKSWGIYGAGRQGKKLAEAMIAKGKSVAFFLDANASPDSAVDGIPCFRKELAPSSALNTPIVVAIHNPQFDALQLKMDLLSAGFTQVFLLQEVVDFYPEISHFWLAPVAPISAMGEQILDGLDCLDDQQSKDVFLSILRFRLLGLPGPDVEGDQYFPTSVPPAKVPLRFVDAGAYDGDTLDYISSRGMKMDWCAAFEPDLVSHAKLVEKHRGPNLLIPCGLSNSTGIVKFQADGSSGKIGGEAANTYIQTLPLDSFLGREEVNFIKMDIEGGEIDALEGARETIIRCQPRLAIASYHDPSHMWRIPTLIRGGGYKGTFMLRTHAANTFESVIYGIEPCQSGPN